MKNSIRNTIGVSNSLDPDQARHFVGSDLGPNFCKGYHQTTLVDKELNHLWLNKSQEYLYCILVKKFLDFKEEFCLLVTRWLKIKCQ